MVRVTVGRDSSVGIATRYGLDGPGIESRWRRDFPHPSGTAPGTHTASCKMGTGSPPEVNRPERGVNYPPQIVPRLKKEYRYTCIPPLGLPGLLQGELYLTSNRVVTAY